MWRNCTHLAVSYNLILPGAFTWRNSTHLASLHLAGAFATTGTMSGTWFVATGEVLSLSEQQIVDCSWDHDVNGCWGERGCCILQLLSLAL